MTSFNRLLVTTEQQAAEINTFATRLDAAYKEMESTNARLKETAFKDDMAPSLYNRVFFSYAWRKRSAVGTSRGAHARWCCSNLRGYVWSRIPSAMPRTTRPYALSHRS